MNKYDTLIESIEDILNDIHNQETDFQLSGDSVENIIECMISDGTFGGYYTLKDIARNSGNERLIEFIETTTIDNETIENAIIDTHTTDYNHGYGCVTNELLSSSFGEIQIDLTDYLHYDENNDTILQYYLDNFDLLNDDINSDLYVADNCGYIDMTQTRASMIFNEDEFFNHPNIKA